MVQACRNHIYSVKQPPVKENHQKARSNWVLVACIALPIIAGLIGIGLVIAGGFIANPPMITVGVSIITATVLGVLKGCLRYRR